MQVIEMPLKPCQNPAPQWSCSARAAEPQVANPFKTSSWDQLLPSSLLSNEKKNLPSQKQIWRPLQLQRNAYYQNGQTYTDSMEYSASPAKKSQGICLESLLREKLTWAPLIQPLITALRLFQSFCFWKEPNIAEEEKAMWGKLSSVQRCITESREPYISSNGHAPQHHRTNLRPLHTYKQGLENYCTQQEEIKRGQNYSVMLRSLNQQGSC